MPLNAHPPTVDAAAFDAKQAAGERSARVDFALWGGLVPGNLDALDELAARGVVGFKAFMSDSGIDDFAAADDLTLYEGMVRAAALELPVAVHAESDRITSGLAARAVVQGRTSMRDWLASRPVIAETEAIARAIHLAEAAGCALHVVHVSTGRGVALVAEARERGVDVTCETCPHYLVLDEDDAERLGVLAKCAPPLRPRAEVDALWAALQDGRLPMVASDHSPAPPALKRGDAFSAWGGIAGAQTTVALVAGDGRLPPARLADVLAGFPARRFRLAGKGALEPGADADLTLVDLAGRDVLRAQDLHQRHPLSPFVGRTLPARVVRTILRGRTVFAAGRLVGEPAGRLLRPARIPA
jgi:allantoinase